MKKINVRIEQDAVDSEGDISYYVHINNLNDYFTLNKDGEVAIRLTTLFCELLNIHTHEDYMNLLEEYDIKHQVNHYPTKDTYVYVVLTDGVIDKIQWNDGSYVRNVYDLGKVFYTREEAEQHVKREKAIRKVTDRIKELNDGWYPDWNNSEQHKWIFDYYNHREGYVLFSDVTTRQIFESKFYMESVDTCRTVLRELDDEIRLILGVEE